ncbi:hypothetical protein L227DRAFT_574962 [Lentinus tigrinus ALCF2SS1-6]|uniref:Uncharacterized protein n=1 Tax=Lentinus tigrinus ALCF2SS1-6 TaxID=1328759 RepID=A0A5C2SCF1_9APHY|nr:hypothetical protein L227DRAFT_574962 [Lentinus tigrinus ALCF2SS1-6]
MRQASMPRSPQCENVTLWRAVPGQQVANAHSPRHPRACACHMGLEWVIRPRRRCSAPRTTTSLIATRGSS